jgi:hypothetical protein
VCFWGEHTPPACDFRRPAENVFPQNASRRKYRDVGLRVQAGRLNRPAGRLRSQSQHVAQASGFLEGLILVCWILNNLALRSGGGKKKTGGFLWETRPPCSVKAD